MATAIYSDAVFRAVSDPTRRGLLDLLAGGEQSVSELVARFDVSQPAISQHLSVLSGAGLTRVRQVGRQRLYSLEALPLSLVYDWAAHYERFWDARLAHLGKYLDKRGRGK